MTQLPVIGRKIEGKSQQKKIGLVAKAGRDKNDQFTDRPWETDW